MGQYRAGIWMGRMMANFVSVSLTMDRDRVTTLESNAIAERYKTRQNTMNERFSREAYERAKAELLQLRDPSPDREPAHNENDGNTVWTRPQVKGSRSGSLDIDAALESLEAALKQELDNFGMRWSLDTTVRNAIDDMRRVTKKALLDATRARELAEKELREETRVRRQCQDSVEEEIKRLRAKEADIIAKQKESLRKQLLRERATVQKEMAERFDAKWKNEVDRIERAADARADQRCRVACKEMDEKLEDIENSLITQMTRFESDLRDAKEQSEAQLRTELLKREQLEMVHEQATKQLTVLQQRLGQIEIENESVLQKLHLEQQQRLELEQKLAAKIELQRREIDDTEAQWSLRCQELDSRALEDNRRAELALKEAQEQHQQQLDCVYERIKTIVLQKDAEIAALKQQIEQYLKQMLDATKV